MFPRGKLRPDDEGQLKIAFTIHENNTLVISFGKPITWVGFGLAEVTALREKLEEYERILKSRVD